MSNAVSAIPIGGNISMPMRIIRKRTTAAVTPPITITDPTSSVSSSPSSSEIDLNELIAAYASPSPSPPPAAAAATGFNRNTIANEAEEPYGDDADEEDEEGDVEEIVPIAAGTDRRKRLCTVSLTKSKQKRSSSISDHRLAPNNRFLSNMIRSTLRHNERVEHVIMPTRGLTEKNNNTNGNENSLLMSDDIQVFDPRGTFNSHSHTLMKQSQQGINSGSPPLEMDSVEDEAQRLIMQFEGNSKLVHGKPRTVRGRGRVMASISHVHAQSHADVNEDMDMNELRVRSSSAGTSNNSASAVGNTVAAAHLHTNEQRASYIATHAKYRRARGVTLLHHIAKLYGIHIVVQPLNTSEEQAIQAQTQADANTIYKRSESPLSDELEEVYEDEEQDEFITPSSNTPSDSMKVNVRRTFDLGVGPSTAPTIIPSVNAVAGNTVPASSSTASISSGRKPLNLKLRGGIDSSTSTAPTTSIPITIVNNQQQQHQPQPNSSPTVTAVPSSSRKRKVEEDEERRNVNDTTTIPTNTSNAAAVPIAVSFRKLIPFICAASSSSSSPSITSLLMKRKRSGVGGIFGSALAGLRNNTHHNNTSTK
jgi:hypothetical protein